MITTKKRLEQLYKQKKEIEEEIEFLEKNLLKDISKKNSFSKDEKINIFKSLFINRFDIYAKKSINNNKREVFSVAKDFKGENFLSLKDEEVELHLRGVFHLASYIINSKNLCKYCVFEIINEDRFKFQTLLTSFGIRAYFEKSYINTLRAWIFFQGEIDSKIVHLFMNKILQKAKIYAKIFPKEPLINNENLGSYIQLPLNLKYRQNNKTIFFDINTLKVYEDQWRVLNGVQRLRKEQVLLLCKDEDIKKSSSFVPKENNNSTLTIKLIIYDFLYIPIKNLSKNLLNILKSFASFENPQIKILLSLRKPLYNTPKVIKNYEENGTYLKLPRGTIYKVFSLFKKYNINYIVEGKKILLKIKTKKVKFTLRQEQEEAIQNILKTDFSICVAPPGFGKTLIGSKMIELRSCNTLVIVNKNILLSQWIDRFMEYFSYEKKDIGYLGKGKNKLTNILDIATMQSLKNNTTIINNYSFVIVDECHHIPAVTFEQIIKQFHGKYLLGLSATPKRKDGLDPILFQQLGEISYEHQNKKTKINLLKIVKTAFVSQADNYAALINELCLNENRNLLIIKEIKNIIKRKILVLSDRIEHLKILQDMLNMEGIKNICIHGSMNKKEQRENMDKIKSNNLILSSTSYFGEGIDFPHLNTIIFATPISYYGRVIQYLGRVGRDGQETLAIDFLDEQNAMLNSAYKKRLEGYNQMHYKQIKE